MRLKRVGFFRELDHGMENGASLKDSVLQKPQANEDKIIKYLKTGIVYCNSPGLVMDVLVKENGVIGNLNILTDGEWIWPSDLSYYVELYHVKLNEDFVMHMEKVNWIMLNQQEIKWDQFEL